MCCWTCILFITKKTQIESNIKTIYEDELLRALDEDGSRTSVYISPQSYFLEMVYNESIATGKRSQAISDRSGQGISL